MVNINSECSSASQIISSSSSPIYRPFPIYRSPDRCKFLVNLCGVSTVHKHRRHTGSTEQCDGDGRDRVGMLACSCLPPHSSFRGLKWTGRNDGQVGLRIHFRGFGTEPSLM